MARSQFGVLVHELTHMYNTRDRLEEAIVSPEAEKMLIQEMVDLDAEGSVGNAQSYAAYASAVVADCRSWPMPPTRRNDEVDL